MANGRRETIQLFCHCPQIVPLLKRREGKMSEDVREEKCPPISGEFQMGSEKLQGLATLWELYYTGGL